MDIPDKAVEAVAKAIYCARFSPGYWGGVDTTTREMYLDMAKSAYTAAAPFMQGISENAHKQSVELAYEEGFADGIEAAAKLVEEGANSYIERWALPTAIRALKPPE